MLGFCLPVEKCDSGLDKSFVLALVDFCSLLSSGGDGIGGGGPSVGERGTRVRLDTDRFAFELLFLKKIEHVKMNKRSFQLQIILPCIKHIL